MRACLCQFASLVLIASLASATACLGAQKPKALQTPATKTLPPLDARQMPQQSHRFWDRTNLMLFAGVAAVRALDYTSTQHFREQGNNEVLLSNSVVDNKPLFAGIEVAGTALSVGICYWLHRAGHHKLERWVSVVHISAATFGDIHNYTLAPPR